VQLTVRMTSETSYNKAFDEAQSSYTKAYLNPLAKYQSVPPMPTALVDLLSHERVIKQKVSELSSIKIQPFSFDATSNVINYYDSLDAQQNKRKVELKEEAENEKNRLVAEHAKSVTEAKSYNDSLIEPLKKKHSELLEYKDDLTYVFEHYAISPLDIDISDSISIDEFSSLIDESLNICLKYVKKEKGLFNKIIQPLKNEKNLTVSLTYVIVAIVLIYLLLPFICVPAIVLMFLSIHGMYKDLEKLRIARALMSQLDYNRFIPEESFKKVDDLDITYVDVDLVKKLDEVKDYTEERNLALAELKKESTKLQSKCIEITNSITKEYSRVINMYKEELSRTQSKIQELMKDYAPFPTVQNDSVVMKHDYTLGRLDGRLDVTATLPMLNIVFNANDRVTALNNMKLYLANALLSVRVKQLTVEIYDPKNMCGDFTEFFTQETKPYIKPNNMSLEDLLKTYKQYSQENILVLNKKSIDDFNKDAEERELVPKAYKLLLLVSEFDKVNEGEQQRLFSEYFKFSASSGVMVWLLDTKQWPNSIWVDGSYSLKGESLKYDESIGKQAVETFSKALANYKDTGIDYVSKFGNVFIPEEKWWTFDTITGINMPFGLENGDPTRGLNVAPRIGDANVHALLGGATGAGKSAAINQLLISLICMYPPSELQIVYIDFKNVEAAKFTQGYDTVSKRWFSSEEEKSYRERSEYYSRLSRIPHLRIISGTTDGEYALSVFEFLMKEMADRQKIINMFGVTKIEEMRKQILAKYNTEHNGDPKKGTWADMRKDWEWYKPNVYDKYGDLPRLLVIFDEFQVMYNPEFVDNRTIDTINGKITAITKLARAMATHFWFTSQSMKGTMSKDTMGNFSLRGALRCTDDVSDELLGNKAASTITSKFGFMYTNDTAGQDKEANRLWRVPFLDEKDMPKYIDKLLCMLEPFNEKHCMAEFYDEKILVPGKCMLDWYQKYPEIFGNSNTFILGERANFSTNKAPVAVSLQDDGGENVMIAAFDRNDMLNLTMTFVNNVKESGATIIMNVQDLETHTLLDVENIVDPAYLSLSYPKQDIPEFIDALCTITERRIEAGGTFKPIYVFCIQWERAPGISVDTNYRLGDKFKDLIRKAPNVGIHFIFASREKLDMQRFIPAACNHRIAGLLPKDCNFFIETLKPEKLPDATKDAGLFAFYEFGTTLHKFRIYQHTFTKELKSREVVI